jgi:hypothetical protein
VAYTDIETSSDEYKLKVVALFFGVHSLRKAAFWKNIGCLGLSENNFVSFYGNTPSAVRWPRQISNRIQPPLLESSGIPGVVSLRARRSRRT